MNGERPWEGARDEARERRWLALLAAENVPCATEGALEPAGVAASLEPECGDPQALAVIPRGDTEAFWVDRRTMRVTRHPRTSYAREEDVVRAADLADRVQLATGEPVSVHYATRDGRPVVTGLWPLMVQLRFTNASYRETAALNAEAATLAPLSVDALSRALRIEGDRGEEPRVRRLFARAYRRIDAHHTPWMRETTPGLHELRRLARLGRDVSLALNDARTFRSHAVVSVTRARTQNLVGLDRRDLAEALEQRMALVTRALGLLERSRLATLALLPLLEASVGTLARGEFEALSAPRRTPERVAADERLTRFAERCHAQHGALRVPQPEDGELFGAWNELGRELAALRILGMDVRPRALGDSDADRLSAVQEAWALHRAHPEEARRAAEQVLCRRAARGLVASSSCRTIILLMGRIADGKGLLAETLASALLVLRAAAEEAGRRLVSEGILEQPEDTLYMQLDEIEEALEGELGAYAARVRLRREDDRRWRNFAAPRWIQGRRSLDGTA